MELRSRSLIPVNDIERQRAQDAIDNQRDLERRTNQAKKLPKVVYKECRLSYRLGALAKRIPEVASNIEGLRAMLRATQDSLGVDRDIKTTAAYARALRAWSEIAGEPYDDT